MYTADFWLFWECILLNSVAARSFSNKVHFLMKMCALWSVFILFNARFCVAQVVLGSLFFIFPHGFLPEYLGFFHVSFHILNMFS